MVAIASILISEPQTLSDALGQVELRQPPNPLDWGSTADEVTFILRVASVVGAPTSWSLGVKFQGCQPHTDGYQFTNPAWFDLQPENIKSCVIEGVGWYGGAATPPAAGGFGTVATQADTLPVTVQRTIRHFGLRTSLLLNPTFVGGTSPGLHVSLIAIPKGPTA